jgi:hypothetical protein
MVKFRKLCIESDDESVEVTKVGCCVNLRVPPAAGGALMQTIELVRDPSDGDGDVVVNLADDCSQIPFAPKSQEVLAVGGGASSHSKGFVGVPFSVRVDFDEASLMSVASGTNAILNVVDSMGAGFNVSLNQTGATQLTLSYVKFGAGVELRGRLFIWGCPPA